MEEEPPPPQQQQNDAPQIGKLLQDLSRTNGAALDTVGFNGQFNRILESVGGARGGEWSEKKLARLKNAYEKMRREVPDERTRAAFLVSAAVLGPDVAGNRLKEDSPKLNEFVKSAKAISASASAGDLLDLKTADFAGWLGDGFGAELFGFAMNLGLSPVKFASNLAKYGFSKALGTIAEKAQRWYNEGKIAASLGKEAGNLQQSVRDVRENPATAPFFSPGYAYRAEPAAGLTPVQRLQRARALKSAGKELSPEDQALLDANKRSARRKAEVADVVETEEQKAKREAEEKARGERAERKKEYKEAKARLTQLNQMKKEDLAELSPEEREKMEKKQKEDRALVAQYNASEKRRKDENRARRGGSSDAALPGKEPAGAAARAGGDSPKGGKRPSEASAGGERGSEKAQSPAKAESPPEDKAEGPPKKGKLNRRSTRVDVDGAADLEEREARATRDRLIRTTGTLTPEQKDELTKATRFLDEIGNNRAVRKEALRMSRILDDEDGSDRPPTRGAAAREARGDERPSSASRPKTRGRRTSSGGDDGGEEDGNGRRESARRSKGSGGRSADRSGDRSGEGDADGGRRSRAAPPKSRRRGRSDADADDGPVGGGSASTSGSSKTSKRKRDAPGPRPASGSSADGRRGSPVTDEERKRGRATRFDRKQAKKTERQERRVQREKRRETGEVGARAPDPNSNRSRRRSERVRRTDGELKPPAQQAARIGRPISVAPLRPPHPAPAAGVARLRDPALDRDHVPPGRTIEAARRHGSWATSVDPTTAWSHAGRSVGHAEGWSRIANRPRGLATAYSVNWSSALRCEGESPPAQVPKRAPRGVAMVATW